MIASFPFQDFQNMMWAGGHYSLLIIAKNLYNPAETSNNEILNGASKIHAVKIHAVVITIIMHIMKYLGIVKNPCGQKWETSNQLCLALLYNYTTV